MTPLRHVAAYGAARLPERRAGFARGELQQPRELRRVAAGRAHPAVAAPTRRSASAARTASTASSPRACCRSRTSSTARSVRSAIIRPGERPLHALRERGVEYVEVRLMDLDPFCAGRHRGGHDALPRRLPAALPARREPARHARRDLGARRATSTALRRAAASRGSRSMRGGQEVALVEWGGQVLAECEPIAAALDAANGVSLYSEALVAAVAALGDAASVPSARDAARDAGALRRRLPPLRSRALGAARGLRWKRCRSRPRCSSASRIWRRSRWRSSGASRPRTTSRSRRTGSATSRRSSSGPRLRPRSERAGAGAASRAGPSPGNGTPQGSGRRPVRRASALSLPDLHRLGALPGPIVPFRLSDLLREPPGNRRGDTPQESPVQVPPHVVPGAMVIRACDGRLPRDRDSDGLQIECERLAVGAPVLVV